MPIVDGNDVSPDEAMLLGLCPECGQPLIPKNARAHASSHFFGRDPNDPLLSAEAQRRYKLIIDFAAARYDAVTEREKREEANSDRIGMSSTPSDKPVKTFLDYVALGLILEAASAFWRGEDWSRVVAGLIGGGAVLAAHYRWDWLKETLGDRFTTTARSVATDFRWWLVPLFLLFIYVGSPTLISEVGKAITTTSAVETEIDELKANEWPTLTTRTIDAISKVLAAAGPHHYDLDSCTSPDCIYFSNGLRTAFAKAGWLPAVPAPPRAWSIPPPPGWAANGNEDDSGLKAVRDAILQNLHVTIPTGRFSAPEGMHWVSLRIGQKQFDIQLSQNDNSN
jgi:hypothetical protein